MITDIQYIKQLCEQKAIYPKTIVPFSGTFKDIGDNIDTQKTLFFGDLSINAVVLQSKYPGSIVWNEGGLGIPDWRAFNMLSTLLKGHVNFSTECDSVYQQVYTIPNLLFDELGFCKSTQTITGDKQHIGSFDKLDSIWSPTNEYNNYPFEWLGASDLNKLSNTGAPSAGVYLSWVTGLNDNAEYDPPIINFTGFKITF